MKVFVDTSAIAAILDRSDERSDAAYRWLGSYQGELVTNNYVIVESTALIDRHIGREAVARMQRSIVPLLEVHWLSTEQHHRAMDAHLVGSRRSSFVDQSCFVSMKDLGIDTAFTLDEDFQRAGFVTVP